MNGFPALVAVGLALGIAIAVKGVPPDATTASLFVSSAKAERAVAGNRFLLRSAGDLACEVVRGAARGRGIYALKPAADCERLLPGLSQVRFWRERDDAVVVFSRDGTDDLVTFAVADGVAYESFLPSSALISLAVGD